MAQINQQKKYGENSVAVTGIMEMTRYCNAKIVVSLVYLSNLSSTLHNSTRSMETAFKIVKRQTRSQDVNFR